jgi:hypothetical protein
LNSLTLVVITYYRKLKLSSKLLNFELSNFPSKNIVVDSMVSYMVDSQVHHSSIGRVSLSNLKFLSLVGVKSQR